MRSVRSRSHSLGQYGTRGSGIGTIRTRGAGRLASFCAKPTAIPRSDITQEKLPKPANSKFALADNRCVSNIFFPSFRSFLLLKEGLEKRQLVIISF
eukprot:6204806-Pleurochrysis_carterae.AAC.1